MRVYDSFKTFPPQWKGKPWRGKIFALGTIDKDLYLQ